MPRELEIIWKNQFHVKRVFLNTFFYCLGGSFDVQCVS